MGECIDKIWLPQCLSMGISYETFLILNPKKIKPFTKAFKDKKEEELSILNYQAWLNGLYIAHAIGSCFSKNSKYPQQPFDFTEKNEISVKEKMEIWAIHVNNEFDRLHPELKSDDLDKSESQ